VKAGDLVGIKRHPLDSREENLAFVVQLPGERPGAPPTWAGVRFLNDQLNSNWDSVGYPVDKLTLISSG
jgi:hypothetical protein